MTLIRVLPKSDPNLSRLLLSPRFSLNPMWHFMSLLYNSITILPNNVKKCMTSFMNDYFIATFSSLVLFNPASAELRGSANSLLYALQKLNQGI